MLTCYILANVLWLEIRTQNATHIYNVDTINYISSNDGFPNEIVFSTNESEKYIYLDKITIEEFKTCLAKATMK